MAVANEFSQNVSVYLGSSSGGFTGPTNFPAGSGPFAVASGDFDNDGQPDLAVAGIGPIGNSAPDFVAILRGDGAGGFAAPVLHQVGDRPGFLAVGDVDGDGELDIAVSNSASNSVSVLTGTAGLGFVQAVNVATRPGPNGI